MPVFYRTTGSVHCSQGSFHLEHIYMYMLFILFYIHLVGFEEPVV